MRKRCIFGLFFGWFFFFLKTQIKEPVSLETVEFPRRKNEVLYPKEQSRQGLCRMDFSFQSRINGH